MKNKPFYFFLRKELFCNFGEHSLEGSLYEAGWRGDQALEIGVEEAGLSFINWLCFSRSIARLAQKVKVDVLFQHTI